MNNKTLVTRESVFAAAEAIREDGKNPTMASIRDALGGGSFTSISPLLAEWKNGQAKAAVALKVPVPQALHLALQDVAEQAWGMAQDSAASRLQNEREALHTAAQELQSREAEMLDELSANEDALARLNEDLVAVRESASVASSEAATIKAIQEAKIGELSVENARISEGLRSTREQLEKSSEDLTKANAKLENERSTSVRLEAKRADLAHDLDVEQGKLRIADEELAEARSQATNFKSQLDKALQETLGIKQQLAREEARATAHAEGMQKLIDQLQDQLQGERLRCDNLQNQLVELAKQKTVAPVEVKPEEGPKA